MVDAVADNLRGEILSGRYAPGEYLPPARELAERYEVTRTSLKHALMRLVESGLLEIRHGVGTRVLDYEQRGGLDLLPMLVAANAPGWAQSIFEVRAEVGALIAVRAAARATDEQRAGLGELAGRVRAATTPDAAQLAECEWHRALARATGNRVYPLLTNVVLDTYLRQRQLLLGPFLDPGAAADRLDPLDAAVREGAPRPVVHELATDYLERTGRLMIESMLSGQGGAR
ncbi:FadR family transcriptional regulator [Amycolatopsis sp. K13G38]|uniref:FadR family transcriptional regulator n=1 Tax=Amycolatopsis acididurans TaxID=2724524 RepID=A0ABX1IZB6_9PSEU|nr:FadR family transcriptional regulator [Amycolatopsis acididurans]